MLYTIITDGKNSLFSTSYRPDGTIFKLVGISSKAILMSHITKEQIFSVFVFLKKKVLRDSYIFFTKLG